MKIRALSALAGLLALTGAAFPQDLPSRVAAPPLRPQSQDAVPASPPVPTERPVTPIVAPIPEDTPDAIAPVPSPRPPDNLPSNTDAREKAADPADLLRMPPPDLGGPKSANVMPAEETACRSELNALGAVFKELPSVQEPAGCIIPHPLSVTKLTSDIAIVPDITLNCATALASAKFARDVMSPAAQKAYGSPIVSISQASGYVCRPRNGTQKLSEHAFGNAVDIASVTLADKQAIAVEPAPPAKTAGFLREVRAAACGPFKTVLGPGSDADHSLHLHFDLAQRRNGGTFCQ